MGAAHPATAPAGDLLTRGVLLILRVESGLGYQIRNSRDQLAHDQMMAVILMIGDLDAATLPRPHQN